MVLLKIRSKLFPIQLLCGYHKTEKNIVEALVAPATTSIKSLAIYSIEL
jgi:hypothetical protein